MPPTGPLPPPSETPVVTLANGVRVVAIPLPQLQTASVGIYLRVGSGDEPRPLNGISHFVEHMVFKGTATRDVQRVNLDAERLGAELNAHTDKDHTAYYMRGRGEHAGHFVRMLADIVRHATFPAAEIEREREVLLQEEAEIADDPMDTAYQLFDHACWGLHAAAQAVIGPRRNIERLRRDDLVGWASEHHVGARIVVVGAGPIDAEAFAREVEAALADLPRGATAAPPPPAYGGGLRTRRLAGSSQTHVVLGFPIGARGDVDASADVAAAVFGDGMSSPLLGELRERRGLVYHAACAADRYMLCGQFAVEASVPPPRFDEFVRELAALLRRQAAATDAVDLERARNQIAVRLLRDHDRPSRRMEQAALDLYAFGRVRSAAEQLDRVEAVTAAAVSAVFERALAGGAAVALAGSVGRAAADRVRASGLLRA